MGFSIKKADGKNSPVLTCDTCGKLIKYEELAIITFPISRNKAVVALGGIYHEGRCTPRHLGDRTLEGDWMPLNDYVSWLLWNHKFGKKVVTAQRRLIIVDVPIPIDLCRFSG